MRYTRMDSGLKKLLFIEIAIIVIMIGMFTRKPFLYEMNANGMEITDMTAYYDEARNRVCVSGVVAGEESGFPRWIGGSRKLDVPCGIYEIEAFYYSELYPIQNGGGSCADKTSIIQLISGEMTDSIAYNPLGTYDGSATSKERVVIKALNGIDDLQIKVCFMGMGKFEIEKVVLRELPIWRLTAILGSILAFLLVDGLYYYFFVKKNPNRVVMAGILGTIFFTSLPMFTDFLFEAPGHDLDFHMMRILSLANEIGEGRWISPISDTVNHHGYATPIFYGQLFLYIPAILYNLALPLQTCYQVYVILINAVTSIVCYVCFNSLIKDNRIALIGSFLYTAAPYRMCNIYLRSAVGEYTAMVFLPLIVYGFIKVYISKEQKIKAIDWLPITMGLTGVIHSHILSCEMAAIFIMGFCIVFIRKTVKAQRFMALLKAASVTIVLNIGFILPLLNSMSMELSVNVRKPDLIQSTGVYMIQLFSPFMTFSGGEVSSGMSGEMPLSLGIALALGMVLTVLCFSKKADKNTNELLNVGVICVVIAMIALWFSLRIFPWDSIQSLSEVTARLFGMVQFCWRYIGIATVMASFATVIGLNAYVYDTEKKEGRYVGCVLVGATIICVGLFFTQFCNSAATLTMYGYVGDGVQNALGGGGEYLPVGTTSEELNRRHIYTDAEVVTVRDYHYEKGITTFWCENSSNENSYVDIPVIIYDNYRALDIQSGEEIIIEHGVNGRMKLIIPAEYEGTIEVKYEIPWLWKISYLISALTATCIVVYIIRKHSLLICKNRNKRTVMGEVNE